MRILGIDPGLARLGWSVLEVKSGKPARINYGCIETPAHRPLNERLAQIYDDLIELANHHQPNEMAIETLFFAKNAKTLAQVGHVRGVILLLAGQRKWDVFEYAPRQIKLALTGFGGADKKQMQLVVQRLLNLPSIPHPDDAADAVAVALCHNQYAHPLGRSAVTV